MPAAIIVVHDDPDVRNLALRALQKAGHEAAAFDDPMAALDAIEADSRARVLITRVTYRPGKPNGVALARMIRFKRPGIKIIFLARPENEVHTEGLGVFLRSPLDEGALVATVGRLLREQAIGEAAYFIWEQEGRPEGRADEHWQRAMAEIHGSRSGETQGGDEETPIGISG